MDCMEEKNVTVAMSDHQSPVITTNDHEPPGSQEAVHVHQEATTGGRGDHTLMAPNNNNNNNHAYVAVVGSEALGTAESLLDNSIKKKRGRPRKYDVEANLASPPPSLPPSGLLPSFSSESYEKRGRGRPRGSGKLQLLASLGGFAAETAGGNFTPHVVTVYAGEDVVSKVILFTQRGARAICVLSATGVVSSVILRQPGSSGGILRYDGRFEILSLSGSFTFGEMGGAHCKNGMLSVSMAQPDGRVFGGGVAGFLIAAGPIQLIIASFKQNIGKELKRRQLIESPTGGGQLGTPNIVGVPIKVSGTADGEENCCTPTSAISEPRNEEAGNTITEMQNANANSQNNSSQNILQSPQPISEQRILPEANVGVSS